MGPLVLSLSAFAVTIAGVFLIAFVKGAFGGGFALVGIPLLSLAMDPLTAGAILAPLFIVMDVVALRYWSPSTWSRPDLKTLVPAMLVGTAVGTWVLAELDERAIAILMAVVSLAFTLLWLRGGAQVTVRDRSLPAAVAAGFGSGLTSMVAHAGGPPLAMYMLGLGLSKGLYAGTTSIFFTFGNLAKAGPWLWISPPDGTMLWLMAASAPAIPPAIWLGWKWHERLDQLTVYRLCYGLLALSAVKLLWDGITGYL